MTAQEATAPDHSTLLRSLGCLYESEHLGVVTANLERVLDANDGFLRMIGFSREQMCAGAIDWRALTPPEWRKSDEDALQQLIDNGASVPFEKEYELRDGSRVPILIGALRLRSEPLEWMCWIVNLSDRKRTEKAEAEQRNLHVQQDVVNHLAHELNNPLAALTFLVELLRTKVSTEDPEIRTLFSQASEMIARMSVLTRAVLAAGARANK